MEFYKNFYRNKSENKGYLFKFTHERSLENISNELLICIATVGLMAVVADGHADSREVEDTLDQCQIGPINKNLNSESKKQLLNGIKSYKP